MSHAEIRALCHAEAMKWVDVQRDQFRRLGVSGDWDHPYLTLDPRYEAGILDVLADLLDGGYVFRQLKPIHWCMNDRTALAEAELEYRDETTPSIYVNFPMVSGVPDVVGPSRPLARDDLDDDARGPCRPTSRSPSIPTSTTPASATSTRRPGRTVRTILAADLVAKVMALRRGHRVRRGRPRAGAGTSSTREYRHPFIDRVSPIVLAGYVSVEDGTGLVHTAPGHGAEDYQTGPGLPAPDPQPGRRRRAGSPTRPPTGCVGKQVFAANPDDRRACSDESGHLFHELPFVAQLSRTAGGARSR